MLIKTKLITFTLLLLLGLTACQEALDPEPNFVNLLGENTFPEGIITRNNGDLFVGGFGDGSIQKIVGGTNVSYFSAPGQNGMEIAVGLAIDESRDRLWVANFNFNTGDGVPGSQLKVFDINNGTLLRTIPETFIPGVFFNEVALDDDGNLYISDTFNPQIWKANVGLDSVSVFVNDPLLSNPAPDQPFDLNGLAITENGDYLIASVMDRLDAGDGRLVRIEIANKAVSNVNLNGSQAVNAFAGSDGMFFERGLLFMVNVFSPAGAIITADFNSDFSSADLVIRDRFQDVYNRPTASSIRRGRLWTVNSQLDHIIDDNNGALGTPPDRPFQVVNVSIKELLK